MSRTVGRCLLLAALALGATGCGAGLITGVVAADNGNGTTAPASPPQLSLPDARFPLVPGDTSATVARTVVVANTQVPATARITVRIRALGLEVDQASPVIVSGQGASTVIGFRLETAPFVAALSDPTQADVDGEFAVFVDGRPVAAPVPVRLLKQPKARLYRGAPQFLSPLGGQRVTLAVRGLHTTTTTGLAMSVRTADPTGLLPTSTRICSRLQFESPDPQLPPLDPDEALLSAEVPGNTFAGPAELIVEDVVAGRSREVAEAFFQPDVVRALPAQGPTTGGTLVTLIGRALAPLEFTPNGPVPAFDRIEVLFRKGEREVRLPPQDLRTAESSLDRLVFTMPPSPDARPGTVNIVLRARIGATEAEFAAEDRFLFGNPQPVFGPRGVALDRDPVALAPIRLEGAPGGEQVPDFGVLYQEGGVGFVQLLAGQENGMFQRFGQAMRVGDPEVAAERGPVDLVAGDFDGDLVPDLLVVNAGGANAVNHVVLGQAAPRPPLGPVRRVLGVPGTARAAAGDFDGDGHQDLVLLPGPQAPAGSLPSLLLSRSVPGQPTFIAGSTVPVRPLRYDVMVVADVDGDGRLDVACARGGAAPGIDVAFGDGAGGFAGSTSLDLTIPGYTPAPDSPAIGIHVVAEQPLPAVAVVLAGLPSLAPPQPHPTTPPVVAVLRQGAARSLTQPAASNVTTGPDPLAVSCSANLDRSGLDELVLAAVDPAVFPITILRYVGGRFDPITEGVQLGAEQYLDTKALYFGTAIPAGLLRSRESLAMFVAHETQADGVRERRLSTMLVFTDVSGTQVALLAPDVGGPYELPIRGLVTANLTPLSASLGGRAYDLALASTGLVRILANDGVGGFFAATITMPESRLLPATVVRVPASPEVIDGVAFATDDGRLGFWRPFYPEPPELPELIQSPTAVTPDLRAFVEPRLQQVPIDARSRLRVADLDGDGVLDLAVMLRFAVPVPGEGDAVLFAMRGKAAPGPNEFPFELPEVGDAMPVHGNATSFALGDLAPGSATQRTWLELALAVPQGTTPGAADGDHLRFFRLVDGAPGGLRWERTFDSGGAQVLLAGTAPTLVEAADFDGNGTVDLLVASEGSAPERAALSMFLNSGVPALDPRHFAIEALHESFASPRPAAPGKPRFLVLGDINGDGNVDALLASEETGPAARSTSVGFYISSGTGSMDGPSFVPQTRLGNRDASIVLDIGDCNGDGVPDLPVGWGNAGANNRNLRVLFAGSR